MTVLADIANPVTATRAILKASALVAEACGGTAVVHGSEIPDARASAMPERCMVVQSAGGRGLVGSRDNVPISSKRLDIVCYGRTRVEADSLAFVAEHVLKRWVSRRASNRAYVHGYEIVAGPVPFEHPDTGWIASTVTVIVQLADELIPA